MSKFVHNLIKAEYDRRQKYALDNLSVKKNEIYQKIPEFKQIDERIRTLGINTSKAILNNTTFYSNTSLELLTQRKLELLEKYGYSADYLKPQYKCSICKDTGVTLDGTANCKCYKQLLIDCLYEQFNLRLTEFENFSCFNAELYADKADSKKYGIDIPPRDNILRIRDKAVAFTENFELANTKNLLFTGPTGVGKTFMANCIARAVLEKGFTVFYSTASAMFSIIAEYRTRNFRDSQLSESSDSGYKNIMSSNLLVIDDLGTEPISSSRHAEFLNILDARRVNNLTHPPCKIIISTNLGVKELNEFYTERVLSRIVQSFDIQLFWGDDLRKKKRRF